jgi:Cu-Zn family superoxide dismutase
MKLLIPAIAAAALMSACGQRNDTETATLPPAEPGAAPASQMPTIAALQLSPTQGNKASGTLSVTSDGTGVRLTGTLQGLAPDAEFGFHIHENGDCSAPDASSAGGHFNPTNAPHGNPAGEAHHAGDLLNARSDAAGTATVDVLASGVSLRSGQPHDVLGKAVVLHEKADDYATQPSGDSGARIACGVITG